MERVRLMSEMMKEREMSTRRNKRKETRNTAGGISVRHA